jgi:hypothetical protein
MSEQIRGYLTRDGRELPCLGTLVRDEEVIQFSNLPPGIRVYLEPRGKVMVRFLASGHVCDFEDPLVGDYLYVHLMKGKKRMPTKEEVESYRRRTRLSALGEMQDTPESREVQLWAEPVVMATQKLMYAWFYEEDARGRDTLEYITILTSLREKLVGIAKAQDWDYSDWSKKNWFRVYLEARKDLFEYYNFHLGFRPEAAQRKVTIAYIDRTKIPPWRPLVTQ